MEKKKKLTTKKVAKKVVKTSSALATAGRRKTKAVKVVKAIKKTTASVKTMASQSKKVVKKILKKSAFAKATARRRKTIKKKVSPHTPHHVTDIGAKLRRVRHNPIIEPSLYSWESKATFNPAAFESDGKVHILYRAVGDDDSSVLGYAYSYDGLNIEGRPTYHVYKRFFNYNENMPKIDYLSGGGWSGGCEDPRLTLIDDTIYMIYTAFDGWGSVRLALTSIKLSDFKKGKWNWKKAQMISPPGQINKNWVLFPEKINGKFAIMHSFYPNILIDYFDSLDYFDGKHFIKSNNTRPVDHTRGWDSWFRGVGPSPIKTKEGWLIIYHAMDHKNPDRYRMGAMLLDLKDPTKILYRSKVPILEPEEDYENNGHKWGVIYSCGAVVKAGELFVYYGGADKYVCVATINLKELVEDLKRDKEVKLTKGNKKEI